jgi:hypothetical protein
MAEFPRITEVKHWRFRPPHHGILKVACGTVQRPSDPITETIVGLWSHDSIKSSVASLASSALANNE